MAEKPGFYAQAVLACAVLLLPLIKWTELPSASMFLWAEDAFTFLRQAREHGVSSFFMPYAGYLHLYPRAAAWIAAQGSPAWAPFVFAAAWWLAYALCARFVIRLTAALEMPFFWRAICVGLVFLQPHEGEVFFSVANAQWLLGFVLIGYFIWLDQRPGHSVSWLDRGVLLIAALSGPFSFLVWPVLIFRRLTEGPAYSMSREHALVVLAGLLQLGVFLSGDRVHRDDGGAFDIAVWLSVFIHLLAFCSATTWQWILSTFVLAAMGMALFKRRVFDRRVGDWSSEIAVVIASLLLLAGIWAHRFDPTQAVPMGAGNRYTWIPYGLMFVVVCWHVSRASRLVRGTLLACVLGLVMLGHRAVTRADLQYLAFADFSRKGAVTVPLNPVIADWPGWYIPLGGDKPVDPSAASFVWRASEGVPVRVSNAALDIKAGAWLIRGQASDPYIVVAVPMFCENARSVGLEVQMSRPESGWTQLFWSQNDRFGERRSLRRFYPSGPIVAQFAFRNMGRATYVRFDPADGAVDALIQSVRVHCLPGN